MTDSLPTPGDHTAMASPVSSSPRRPDIVLAAMVRDDAVEHLQGLVTGQAETMPVKSAAGLKSAEALHFTDVTPAGVPAIKHGNHTEWEAAHANIHHTISPINSLLAAARKGRMGKATSTSYLSKGSRTSVVSTRVSGSEKSTEVNGKVVSGPERERKVYDASLVNLDVDSETSHATVTLIDIETGDHIVAPADSIHEFDPKRYRPFMKDGLHTLADDTDGLEAIQDSSDFQRRLAHEAEGKLHHALVETGALHEHVEHHDLVHAREATNYLLSIAGFNDHEVSGLSTAWRFSLKLLLLATLDDVNCLRLGRVLQLQITTLTGYEAHLLDEVIGALDSKDRAMLSSVLGLAMRNRNVSRAIVSALGGRWDYLWHVSHQIKRNRWYDLWGQLPFVGITTLPGTENFVNARNLVLGSVFRRILGPGHFLTRAITGREALITDDKDVTAMNLAANTNGFEVANRQQHGTSIGRMKTNDFRADNRLPTDESVIRTFITAPFATMLNNGAEHVLRDVATHWARILAEENGDFSHERREMLNPYELLRFQMPQVFMLLTTLRGISEWDAAVLAPMLVKLQAINENTSTPVLHAMVSEIEETIVDKACGGVFGRIAPFRSLLKSVHLALDLIVVEAEKVSKIISSVQVGLVIGTELVKNIPWAHFTDHELVHAVHSVCMNRIPKDDRISAHTVRKAP